MNRYLLLEIALNELNNASKKLKYYKGRTEDCPACIVVEEDDSSDYVDVIADFAEIESFTVGDGYVLLNEKDGSVMKLTENEADWIKFPDLKSAKQ